MNRLTGALLALLVLTGGVVGVVSAQDGTVTENTEDRPTTDRDYQDALDRLQEHYGLTDAEVRELDALVARMLDDGASRAEIKEAVARQLHDWGYDVKRDVARHRFNRLVDRLDLTDAQADELRDLVTDMRANGASREEIREAVADQLAEWDVLPPRAERIAFAADYLGLEYDEVEAIADGAREMRADGASREEVRAYVVKAFADLGVHEDELREARLAYRIHCLAEERGLTDDEAAELTDLAVGLYEDGAAREEIRDAVRDQLEAWGYLDGEGDGHDHRHRPAARR